MRPATGVLRRRTPAARGGGEARSRAEAAYRYLKTELMSARLTPGATLREQEIADALGVSRTPVREAIRRLEQEALVVRHPNRGVLVRQLGLREIREIWQLREILEPAACRLAAGRVDRAALRAVERVIRGVVGRSPSAEAYEAYHRSDIELHALIVASAGNATLAQVVEALNGRVVQARLVTSPARFQASVREHLDIVEALLAGDAEAAGEAMRRHLANAREALAFVG